MLGRSELQQPTLTDKVTLHSFPDIPTEIAGTFRARTERIHLLVHPLFMDNRTPDKSLDEEVFVNYKTARDNLLLSGLRKKLNVIVLEEHTSLGLLEFHCQRLGGGELTYVPTKISNPTPLEERGYCTEREIWKTFVYKLQNLFRPGEVCLSGTILDLYPSTKVDYPIPPEETHPKANKIAKNPITRFLGGCVGYSFAMLLGSNPPFDISISQTTYPYQLKK